MYDRAEIARSNRLTARGLPTSEAQADLKLKREHSHSSVALIVDNTVTFRTAPPFIASHDIVRGIVHAGHVALQYAFMLAVMYVPPPVFLT